MLALIERRVRERKPIAYLTGEAQILRAGLEYSNAEVYKYVAKVARLYQEKRLKRLQTEVRAPNTLQGGSQL